MRLVAVRSGRRLNRDRDGRIYIYGLSAGHDGVYASRPDQRCKADREQGADGTIREVAILPEIQVADRPGLDSRAHLLHRNITHVDGRNPTDLTGSEGNSIYSIYR